MPLEIVPEVGPKESDRGRGTRRWRGLTSLRRACYARCMVARILVAVLLSLAGALTWAQRIESKEDLDRFNAEITVLEERDREAMSAIAVRGVSVFLTNLTLEHDAMIKLCESYRFGLKTLDDALNGDLALVPSTRLEMYRKQIAFLQAMITIPKGRGGSGEDWDDLGWGEDCEIGVLTGICETGDPSPMEWERWSEILLHLGMYVESGRLSMASRMIPGAIEACGVPPDE